MKTSQLLASCLAVAAGWAEWAASRVAADSSRPNIVVILSDDFGYGSAGCYGADANLVCTPHFDRLAREGRQFTDVSTPSSVCTPTR